MMLKLFRGVCSDKIASFTPLALRLRHTTWSTINDINGEITDTKQGLKNRVLASPKASSYIIGLVGIYLTVWELATLLLSGGCYVAAYLYQLP